MLYIDEDKFPLFNSPFSNKIGFSVKISNQYKGISLCQEEYDLISPRAVQKRRVEFALGRAAAHEALGMIGRDTEAILKGRTHEPIWPEGVVGSITHSNGIAIAAVAPIEQTHGIGIDVQGIKENVSFGITQKVCSKLEFEWVNANKEEKMKRLFMIFSAKESIFKALYPIEKIFLDFCDAELVWYENISAFRGYLKKRAGQDYPVGYSVKVGCTIQKDFIFTYIYL